MSVLLLLSLAGCGGLSALTQPLDTDRLDNQSRERDAVAEVLERAAGLPAEVREAKLCAISQAPFPFYRATAHLFYADLAQLPERQRFEGPLTWLSGDAHPQNFGAFADDEGRVVYDLNDFDESFVGDAQIDVWRLAAGIELMGDELMLDPEDRIEAILSMTDHWIEALDDHSDGDSEDDFALTADEAWGSIDEFLEEVEDERDRDRLLDKWTDGDGRLDLTHEDLTAAPQAWVEGLLDAWPDYVANLDTGLAGEDEWFEIKDVAQRVGAGLGSLGTPRLVVLIEGPSDDDDDDRVLDVKQQGAPAAAEWLELNVDTANHAERVITAQRVLLDEADDHLGWLAFEAGVWSVRERSPRKATLKPEHLDGRRRFRKAAEQWGYVLASAHARGAVTRHYEDEMLDLIDQDPQGFQALVLQIGLSYADVVRADHRAFAAQVRCTP